MTRTPFHSLDLTLRRIVIGGSVPIELLLMSNHRNRLRPAFILPYPLSLLNIHGLASIEPHLLTLTSVLTLLVGTARSEDVLSRWRG